MSRPYDRSQQPAWDGAEHPVFDRNDPLFTPTTNMSTHMRIGHDDHDIVSDYYDDFGE